MDIEIKLGSSSPSAIGKLQAQKEGVLNSLAKVLMSRGLPGAFSIPIPAEQGGGNLNFRPLISRKDGRIMYNMSVKGGTLGKESVVLSGGGNLFLPKDGWTVDGATLKTYVTAAEGIDRERKAKRGVAVTPTVDTDEALDEGETTA